MPETGTQGMDSHDVVTRDTLYEVYTGSEAQDGVASGSNSSDDGNDVDKTMTAIESLRIYSEAVLTISIRMSFQHTFRENFLCRN